MPRRRDLPLRNPKSDSFRVILGARTWDSCLRPRGLITRGNKPREQGNIGRLAPSTRWATHVKTPYWASRPHEAALQSLPLGDQLDSGLLIGCVAMTMHQTPTTMIRNFFYRVSFICKLARITHIRSTRQIHLFAHGLQSYDRV